MNGKRRWKWGIRKKLFVFLLIILGLNVAILLSMGSTLFRAFYLHNKTEELKTSAKRIQNAYTEDPENLFEVVNSVENRNSIVFLLRLDEEGKLQIQYLTRNHYPYGEVDDGGTTPELPDTQGEAGQNDPEPERTEYQNRSETGKEENGAQQEAAGENGPSLTEDLLSNLGEAIPFSFGRRDFLGMPPPVPDKELVAKIPFGEDEMYINDRPADHISLITRLDDTFYLYLETPKEYIKSTADLAVKYTAYLSIGILLAGVVLLYFLAGRFTRPIREIQAVADKISSMDFSESCQIHSNDELGALSESINNMAHELEANIDKLIEANNVLQMDLERQQQTDRMRRQFIANVSHDFKTPLTLIISYAEAILDSKDTREQRDFCKVILDEGNKLSSMVASLLRLSQLESGMQKLEPSIFCLDEILDTVVKSHRILSDQRHLKVEQLYGGECVVEADYPKIEQVVANLYENAVKYAPEGGEIRIRTDRQDGKWRISVENEGEKIPLEEIENLFISFYRADKSRHRDAQSYGLGLAVVKAIVELHGEKCGCENLDDGVRFWFTLSEVRLDEPEEDGQQQEEEKTV